MMIGRKDILYPLVYTASHFIPNRERRMPAR